MGTTRRIRHVCGALLITAAGAFLTGAPGTAQAQYPVDEGHPSASAVFTEAFGPVCGPRATAAYAGAIRQGLTRYQAIVIGNRVGRECLPRVGGWIHEGLRSPRLVLVKPEAAARLPDEP